MPIPIGVLATGVTLTTDWLRTMAAGSARLAISPTNDIYLTNSLNGTVKLNQFGVVQWAKQSLQQATAAVDSSGNLYLATLPTAFTPGNLHLVKYNSSGTIQWQRRIQTDIADGATSGIAIDGSGNIYISGRYSSPSTTYLIAKYNSSGTIQWKITLDKTSLKISNLACDSAGNIYAAGALSESGTDIIPAIIKYNSSGTIQWQRSLTSAAATSVFEGFNDIYIDSSDNIYAAGSMRPNGDDFLLAKYDTSGNIQWSRNWGNSGVSDFGRGVTVDSNGDIYISGDARSAAARVDIAVIKYNSSGTIQWQRNLNRSTNQGFPDTRQIVSNSLNNVITAGAILTSFPTDGSKTGTYTLAGVAWTYGAISATNSSGTFTAGTPTATAGTNSDTESAGSYTDSNITSTADIIYI